jgi:hypothetical protein
MLPRRGRTAVLASGGFRLVSCQRYTLSLGPSSPPVVHHGHPHLASKPKVGFPGSFVFVVGSFCPFQKLCLNRVSRKLPSFAVALNCGIGSSSLKADVNAFDRLHTVRALNSSIDGEK